ncbi:dNTP triphosphohydrolase [Methylobacterium sp. J-048]|uniref:dGTP triphosphohydrolase n=1 Tax=Methylobacterium sp. J-048 TaxID=2836635 RepID=UPI001FBBBF7D|nr:dNTP triphosphohydrolase [Methylobacterium sp. J-048]MCJ2056599.1 dNTP triphosphohydrolase [Methylobacterium sp. J-048]
MQNTTRQVLAATRPAKPKINNNRTQVTRMYGPGDVERTVDEDVRNEKYRSEWRRDYARLIHSPAFRRLQGKTQVFPGHESDFYRNRLTHSLEVAQIAKSVAIMLNATHPAFSGANQIESDIVEFAGLAHDLGHPPFGHNGEEALDECMREHGGFEGNAQTLRIVSRLEKKSIVRLTDNEVRPFDGREDLRAGLNLTYRSLAAVLKYDSQIPERYSDRSKKGVMKGYYGEETELVRAIKEKVAPGLGEGEKFKTIECSIMDIADDIAYSTYDLEDNFKAGFLKPLDLFVLNEEIYQHVAETINSRLEKQYPDYDYVIDAEYVKSVLVFVFDTLLFAIDDDDEALLRDRSLKRQAKKMLTAAKVQQISRKLASDGYARTDFTSSLVGSFISGIEIVQHKSIPQLHQARLDVNTFLQVEVLKNITFETIIRSSGLQVVEYRGKEIVKSIFNALADKEHDGTRLLPDDFKALCKGSSELVRLRAICDFIAGMTDRYAFEFYGRLHGTSHLTVHKPF